MNGRYFAVYSMTTGEVFFETYNERSAWNETARMSSVKGDYIGLRKVAADGSVLEVLYEDR